MNKKFYAVTAGEYSDYHIITITDDEQRAKNIAKIYDAEVEEYADDEISENEPITYYVDEDGYANSEEKLLSNELKDKVIFGSPRLYAYVDAFSKEEARQKAESLFADIRKAKEDKRRKEAEEYRKRHPFSYFAKRENGRISVMQEDCGKTPTNMVLFGSRAYVMATNAEQAFKIACDLFAKYDAERAGI